MNFFTNSLSNGTENIKIHRDSIENEQIILLGGNSNPPSYTRIQVRALKISSQPWDRENTRNGFRLQKSPEIRSDRITNSTNEC